MVTLREIINVDEWGIRSIVQSVPLTQTFAYGEIQKKSGRKVFRFQVLFHSDVVGYVQFVVYPLFGSKVYWYASYGPVLNISNPEILIGLKSELKKITQKHGVVFARLDVTPTISNDSLGNYRKYFTEAPSSSYFGAYFQPRHEWYTDITKDDEAILAAMHQKTRYSVRYAEKKGVKTEVVKEGFSNHLEDFLHLMKTTSGRNNFSLHDDTYYKHYFEEIEKTGNGFLVIAAHEGEILAMHFIVCVGRVAHYVFGASSNSKREVCAPYLAHFDAMREARTRGVSSYNFGAVSVGDDTHWKSLTLFKQKFGGELMVHSPFFDMVNNRVWYYSYTIRKLIKTLLS